MQNDYYPQYPETPIQPETPMQPGESTNKNLKLISGICICLGIVLLVIFGVNLVMHSSKNGTSDELDPNYITIEFDGTKFKVADTYGEIIREISKKRDIYVWAGLLDASNYTKLTSIESYLNDYIIDDKEEYSDGNNKNTVLKTDKSDYPDIFISVDRTISGLDEKNTKIGDADVRVIVYPFQNSQTELKIDGHTLIRKKTTSEEFKEMFEEAEEYQPKDGSATDYKAYDFIYKKRRFSISFSESTDTFDYLEIKTYTKDK